MVKRWNGQPSQETEWPLDEPNDFYDEKGTFRLKQH